MRPFILTLCLAPLLAGCAGSFVTPSTIEGHTQNGAAVQGTVFGGHHTVSGSHVHLLAAGSGGYGTASKSLLTSGTAGTDSIGGYVVGAADGSFSIAGDYTCSPGQHLYLLATGGNSQGVPTGPSNPGIGLMASLGVCPASGSLSAMSTTLNEVSTVAMAYALAPFATDASHIASGAAPASMVGLENAFYNIANLIDPVSGTALAATPAGNGVAPQAAVNTLANILAACVDTDGSNPPTCATLFSNATADGTAFSTQPSETATAAINIAHHPAANVAALYAMVTPSAPFAGSLPTQPADLTLTLQFTTNTSGANALAVDAAGDVWFPMGNTLSALTALGAPMSHSPFTNDSIQGPESLAIDASGNVWLPNYINNSYSRFTPATMSWASAGVPSMNYPSSVAIDPTGNLWFANYNGSTLTEVAPNGNVLGNFTGGGVNLPFQVLSDPSGNIFTPDPNNGRIVETANSGTATSNAPFTGAGLNPAFGFQVAALDSRQDLWVLNQDASISGLNSRTGIALAGTPFHTGSNATSIALTVDGLSNLWALTDQLDATNPAFPDNYTLLGYSAAGTQLLGGTHTFPFTPSSLAVDGSGNLWIAAATQNQIYEVLGLTAPVVTPLSVGVAHNTIAARP